MYGALTLRSSIFFDHAFGARKSLYAYGRASWTHCPCWGEDSFLFLRWQGGRSLLLAFGSGRAIRGVCRDLPYIKLTPYVAGEGVGVFRFSTPPKRSSDSNSPQNFGSVSQNLGSQAYNIPRDKRSILFVFDFRGGEMKKKMTCRMRKT